MPSDIDGPIRTIGRAYHWASPQYIDQMFCDARDHHGILYWYDDVARQHKDLEAQNKPKKK